MTTGLSRQVKNHQNAGKNNHNFFDIFHYNETSHRNFTTTCHLFADKEMSEYIFLQKWLTGYLLKNFAIPFCTP